MQKTWKMTETLAHEYSSESTQRELSNEYQFDRVSRIFKNLCMFVLWTKVASALEGSTSCAIPSRSSLFLNDLESSKKQTNNANEYMQ